MQTPEERFIVEFPHPMTEPILSWNTFWDREAEELCHVMPYALVGGSAITTMSFQAFGEGRFAYLSRDEDGRCTPIYLWGEPFARCMFADAERLPRTITFPMADAVATILDQDGRDALESMRREEVRRYGTMSGDSNIDQVLEEDRFSAQVAYPSPIHHESKKWWLRIPRLGVCYTVENASWQAGGPDNDDLQRISDHILLISAVHAGNRIISRRLALLFSNSFRWGAYKAGDRIAETIARSVCFNEPHIRKLVDDDQKIYLVTKLLLGHHLFFPQSPEALTAMAILGKNPNLDVLVPHGWESVALCQSSSTLIEQCVKNLVLDLALLVKAFVRWDRPESLERVSERDLEIEIRRLILMALALLCGNLEWIDNGDYFAIVPPRKVLELGDVIMPALPKSPARSIIEGASKKGKLEYHRYLAQWSPPDRPDSIKPYTTTMVLFKHTARSMDRKECPAMPWLNRYLRARIEHRAAESARR